MGRLAGEASKKLLKRIVVCALIAINVAITVRFVSAHSYIDLDVYGIGARTLLSGGQLYGELPATAGGITLPFTYPPISAVLLAPATLVPLPVAGALLTVLTIGLLLVVIELVVRSLAPGRSRWLPAVVVLPVAVFLEPVRSTIDHGQINVLLMALVAVDCLARDSRLPRGALVGLAAAVKLTPAAFVLFFLLRKDYRAVVNAGVAFVATTAAGFVFAWSDSVRYWTGTVYDTKRIGAPQYAGNQSLTAMLARLGIDPPGRTAVWLLGAAVILGLASIGMWRAFAGGVPARGLAVNACAILIVSPVSWSHHWVWLVPVLLVFGYLWRAPAAAFLACTGAVLFMVAPQWRIPGTNNREYEWNLTQQLVGNSYLYFAVLVLIVVALGSGLTAPGERAAVASSFRPDEEPSRLC
jgi:alpha-1,2-mannosyltransferase